MVKGNKGDDTSVKLAGDRIGITMTVAQPAFLSNWWPIIKKIIAPDNDRKDNKIYLRYNLSDL